MANDIDISYSLDPSGYLVGVNAIDQANARLAQSTGRVVSQSTLMARAWDVVTPKRAVVAGLLGAAQQASALEQNMSSLSALSTTTGSSLDKLGGGINALARTFPVGQAGARQIVEQFTRMGASAGGSTGKVLALAEASIKLGGATGEGIGELAQGMTELSRATGNTGLDPKRFAALGDSLTTVSAMSGASATNVLSFSKSIAPMAQAAGIGATGILGISTAFSKMGEDGLGASTAVSKMLSDMNKSVRDGSPELKTYASMVGQTTEQFAALFKQNPAQALTQITQAIAKAGPAQAPRMLESIGIEGVRGTRAIQSLVSGGGLESAVKTATDAYGSGSTDKASAAAYGGLNDSLTQLRDTSQQLAQAMGKPLLGALSTFTDILAKPLGIAGKVAESGVGQAVMGGAGILGAGALLGKAVLGPIGTLAIGKQALSSGPLAALMAGIADSTGADPSGRLGRVSRYGRQAAADQRAGGPGFTGMLGKPSQFIYDFVNPDGTVKAPGGPGDPNKIGRRERLRNYGFGGLNTFMGMTSQQLRNAAIPDFNERTDSMGASGNFQAGGRGAASGWRGAREGGQGYVRSTLAGLAGMDRGVNRDDNTAEKVKSNRQTAQDAMDGVSKSAKAAAGSLDGVKSSGAGVKDALKGLGSFAGANVRAAGSLAGTVGKGALGLAGGLVGGPIGLAGIGLTAGIAGISYLANQEADRKQYNKDWSSTDISGQMNTYRESMGMATDPTKTYASTSKSLEDQLASTAAKGDFASSQGITEADKSAADQSREKVLTRYSGSADTIAAQIKGGAPSGISPQELQAIKVDLLRQMDPTAAADVLKRIPSTLSTTQTGGATSIDTRANAMQGISGDAFKTSSVGRIGEGIKITGPLSDEQKKSLDAITGGISQQAAKESDLYEGNYAQDRKNKTYQDLITSAIGQGKEGLAQELARRQSAQLGGDPNANWSAARLSSVGGDVGQLVYEDGGAKGARPVAPGAVKPVVKQEYAYTQVSPESQLVASSLDKTKTGTLQSSMTAALGTPEDVKATSTASDELIRAGQAAGKTLNEMTREITNAASAAGQGTPVWQQLTKTLQEINSRAAMQDLQGLPGDTAETQFSRASERAFNQANGPRGTPEELAVAKQGEADVVALGSQQKQKMQARLMVEFNYQKQVGRMKEGAAIQESRAEEQRGVQQGRMYRDARIAEGRSQDSFNRQQGYAATDFAKSKARSTYDFNLQAGRAQAQFSREMGRAEQDYGVSRARSLRDANTQVLRTTEDFNLSRTRSVRDFGIQAGRAEADYQTSRLRSIRDFNKQMTRQVEDGAKAMMNPYERLKAQATWDIGNLLNNLAEQQKAMEAQKLNLDKARKAGLSSQAIDQLGLGKAENSQQLATIAADLNPDTVKKLNAATAGRAGAAASLFTDASNKELTRSKADFNTSLSDSEADYAKSVKRSRADFAKSLADSQADFSKGIIRSRRDLNKSLTDSEMDFKKSQARSAQDFRRSAEQSRADMARSLGRSEDDFRISNKRSQSEFRIQLSQSRSDLGKAIRDMKTDAATARSNARSDLRKQISYMAQDVKDGDKQLTAVYSTLTKQWGNAINGKFIDWGSVFSGTSKTFLKDIDRNFIPQFNALLDRLGLSRAKTSATTQAAARNASSNPYGAGLSGANKKILGIGRAEGGPVPGHSYHDHQDNVPANLTAGEYVHRVSAVRHYGTDTMRAINEKRVPKEAIMGYAAGGYVRPVARYPSWPHWGYYPGGSRHPAIDFAGSMRTPIHSPFDGTVLVNSWDNTGYGNHLRMVHPGGIYTILGHMASRAYPPVGTRVKQGQVVGPLGSTGRSTGPHVHLEMRRGGAYNSAGSFNYTIPWGMGRVWDGRSFGSGVSNDLADISGAAGLGASLGLGVAAPPAPRLTSRAIDQFAAPYKAKYKVPPAGDYLDNIVNGLKVEFSYDKGGMLKPGQRGKNSTSTPEPVLTNEQWRNISALAKHAAVALTENDVRGSRASQGVSITVNHTGSTTYDQRADFGNATIQVISQDPNEMARKLKAKAVSDRLTATRGTNRRNA